MTAGRGVRTAWLLDGFGAGQVSPDLGGDVASSTMVGGGQTMAAELEVVVDAGVGGQEALRVAG